MTDADLNRRIMQAFKDAEEARIRLLGVLAVLVADEITSSGRARELGAMTIEALRADVVWAVRGYIRPIDDGQRLAIGIDPQTLFTRMVEWDGTDADILRAVREAREG